ncbi:MAG: FixH family protein [Myxococcota bacterium]|jgi:hypothetical protein|nr:FixH family protein [Myxococcota bacterium]
MSKTEDPHGGPWYMHFWPWFIVTLLGCTVVAGILTVILAFRGADPLVVDDYYSSGKAINQTLDADREAGLREARAAVELGDGVTVELEILGELPEGLQLELSHVTRAELDRSFELVRSAAGRYTASEVVPEGRFYATLRPAGAGSSWRLRRQVTLPAEASFAMEPSG